MELSELDGCRGGEAAFLLTSRLESAIHLFFCQERFACFRAAAAGFSADATMFHVLSVLLANRAATFARLNAGAQLRARELEIGARETGNDARCGQTDIRAIVAIANALHHFRHIFLAETGIGARVARFRAGITRGDAFDINRVIR